MLSRWQSTIVDERGNVQPLANLTVRLESDQSLAKMWASPGPTQPLPDGMVQADGNGYAYFYAEGGLYRITSAALGIDWRGVEVGALVAANAAQLTADMAMSTGGMTIFDTFADMTPPGAGPKFSRVINDLDPAKNGYYAWSGSAWVRTTSQPADDSRVIFNDIPQSGSLLHSIPQAGVVNLPFDLDALRVAKNKLLYGDGPFPVLDLQFQGAKLLDPRVDFTRASTGTYTDALGRIRTAAIDEPRFTYDPVTGDAMGLLVEKQATNLLLWSEDFSNGVWLYERAAVIPEATIAPDGSMTASKLVETTDEGLHRLRQTASLIDGRAVLSIYLKPSERHLVQIRNFSGSYGTITYRIDLLTGETTMPTEAFNSAVGSDVLTGGWVRFYGSADFFNGVTIELLDGNSLEDANANYQGDGTSGIYVWGAQLEEGSTSTPTSYIPTGGSQVTRIADIPIIPVTSDWFNPNEGTIYAEIADLRRIGTTAQAFGLFTGGGITSRLIVELLPNVYLRGAGSLTVVGPNLGAVYSGGKGRVALAYKNGTALLAFNGMVQAGDAPEDLNSIKRLSPLSGQASSANESEGEIANIAYYPRALTPAQLQELTS